jgi:hypothetical protein
MTLVVAGAGSMHKDRWDFTVKALFGEDPFFPEYRQACFDKDTVKAQQLLKQGAFAENLHLWNERPLGCYLCCMDGCLLHYHYQAKNVYYLMKSDEKFIKDIIDLGLADLGLAGLSLLRMKIEN